MMARTHTKFPSRLLPGGAARLIVALGLLVAVGAGCGPGRTVEERPAQRGIAPPATPQAVEAVERNLRQALGDQVRVGYVERIFQGLVTITDLDTEGLETGEFFLFFDSLGREVALGEILEVDAEQVVAEFDSRDVEGGRDVREGDLAAFRLTRRNR